MTVDDRSKFLGKMRLCYGCYKPITMSHNAKTCTQRKKCEICKGNHPTGLHGFRLKKKNADEYANRNEDSLKSNATNIGEVISMCVVPVNVIDEVSGRKISTMAMLDSCSQASFVTESLARRLKVEGTPTYLTIKTINGAKKVDSKIINGLKIEGVHLDSERIQLPKLYTREELPGGNSYR